MKGVIDKLYKKTFTEIILHLYYTSGLKFVTDVKKMLKHSTKYFQSWNLSRREGGKYASFIESVVELFKTLLEVSI